MPFDIPNKGAAAHEDQARVDSGDVDILVAAHHGTGVLEGCAVAAQGAPNRTVQVAAGVVAIQTELVAVAAVASLSLGTADGTNPRWVLVWVDAAGVVTANAGTAAALPLYPTITVDGSGHLTRAVLAAVFDPANNATIVATQITDKRVFWDPMTPTEQFLMRQTIR
jgi:hypothetical protein